jgi:hypothetical protein
MARARILGVDSDMPAVTYEINEQAEDMLKVVSQRCVNLYLAALKYFGHHPDLRGVIFQGAVQPLSERLAQVYLLTYLMKESPTSFTVNALTQER